MDNKLILKSRFSLVLFPEKQYYERVLEIIKTIDDSRICYICLAKPYMEIKEDFRQEGISVGNMMFIDTVTSKGRIIPDIENCIFADSPEIMHLNDALKKVDKKGFDVLIFDTASALLMHEPSSNILKFTHGILTNDNLKTNVYFMIKDLSLKRRENQSLVKDLEMFADNKIIL